MQSMSRPHPQALWLKAAGLELGSGSFKRSPEKPAGRWAEPHPSLRACGCENATPRAPRGPRNPALSGQKPRSPQTPTSLSVNRFPDTDRQAPHSRRRSLFWVPPA